MGVWRAVASTASLSFQTSESSASGRSTCQPRPSTASSARRGGDNPPQRSGCGNAARQMHGMHALQGRTDWAGDAVDRLDDAQRIADKGLAPGVALPGVGGGFANTEAADGRSRKHASADGACQHRACGCGLEHPVACARLRACTARAHRVHAC
jgi:hypothetical protein